MGMGSFYNVHYIPHFHSEGVGGVGVKQYRREGARYLAGEWCWRCPPDVSVMFTERKLIRVMRAQVGDVGRGWED